MDRQINHAPNQASKQPKLSDNSFDICLASAQSSVDQAIIHLNQLLDSLDQSDDQTSYQSTQVQQLLKSMSKLTTKMFRLNYRLDTSRVNGTDSDDRSSDRSYDGPPLLLIHQFLASLLFPYLDDVDVLLGMLAVSKAVKPFLKNYPVKRRIAQEVAKGLMNKDRYFVPTFTKLDDVNDPAAPWLVLSKSLGVIEIADFHTSGM